MVNSAIDLFFEIRDKYGLSTGDMAKLFGVRDSTIAKWINGQSSPKDMYGELAQIEEEIEWMISYLKVNPIPYSWVHVKAAINLLDGIENK